MSNEKILSAVEFINEVKEDSRLRRLGPYIVTQDIDLSERVFERLLNLGTGTFKGNVSFHNSFFKIGLIFGKSIFEKDLNLEVMYRNPDHCGYIFLSEARFNGNVNCGTNENLAAMVFYHKAGVGVRLSLFT